MQKLKPLSEVLVQAHGLPAVISPRKMHRYEDQVQRKRNQFVQAFRLVKPDLELPPLPSVREPEDVSSNVIIASERIAEQLLGSDEVGRAIMEGDNMKCYFFAPEKKRGILTNAMKQVKQVHMISRPKFRRLPTKEKVPKRGKEIIDALCEAGLKSEVRIITGDLIGESHEVVREWEEDTALGSFVSSVKERANATRDAMAQGAATLGNAARRNAAGIAAGLGTAAATAAAVVGVGLATTFAADPAIVVGDVCFYCWK